MYDPAQEPAVPDAAAAEPSVRGWPVLAWLVILGLVALVVWSQSQRPPAGQGLLSRALASRTLLFQARVLVAAKNIMGGLDSGLDDTLTALNAGTLEDRLSVVILSGELLGPQKALEILGRMRAHMSRAVLVGMLASPAGVVLEPSALRVAHEPLAGVLWRLYEEYARAEWDAPSLGPEAREQLSAELGWFGDLALAPPAGPEQAARAQVLRPAYRALFTFAGILSLAALVGLGGLVGLIVLLILLFGARLTPGLGPPSAHSGVYAETFAVWLLLFNGISLGLSQLPLPKVVFVWEATVFLLSLGALAWPVLRGIPWRQVRADVGLTAGRNPYLEPLAGLGAYALCVPLAAVGLLITVLLMSSSLGGAVRSPTHPVVDVAPELGWSGRALMLVLACVTAPLVEETFFRGVLYRHLRDATVGLGRAASVLLSALAVSFVFAVIHPQGVLGVPILMSLAFGFTLAREWRNSLVAAMVAHGVHNGVTFGMLFFIVG